MISHDMALWDVLALVIATCGYLMAYVSVFYGAARLYDRWMRR